MFNYIIISLFSILIGALAAMLIASRNKSKLSQQVAMLNERNSQLSDASAKEKQALLEQLKAIKDQHQLALKESAENNQRLMDDQDRRFEQAVNLLSAQVQTSTEKMLKDRQREFSESSNKELDPLRQSIKDMQKALSDNETEQKTVTSDFKAQMEQMIRQNEATRTSTEELTRAFKHKSKVQGDWGEVVLNELLESQGLKEGVNFETQSTLKDADGKTIRPSDGNNLRPDVLLHLDEHRDVIIDSKVSLGNYIDYVNAEDEATRQNCLREHVNSLRRHVDELAAKDYSSYVDSQIDFVVMFVPHTMALVAATNEDPRLWRYAMDKKVFIVDEQTLYAALRIIKLTWTHIEQEQNHQKLYDAASNLLDRVGSFLQTYDAIGEALKKVQKQFDDGQRLLSDHGKSIPVAAQKLIQLGAKNKNQKNQIPVKYKEENLLEEQDTTEDC